jgi:hypothetical protein
MKTTFDTPVAEIVANSLNDNQVASLLTSVAPAHPALRRLHERLNTSAGAEAAITSYDRMHHRHNR